MMGICFGNEIKISIGSQREEKCKTKPEKWGKNGKQNETKNPKVERLVMQRASRGAGQRMRLCVPACRQKAGGKAVAMSGCH